MSVQDNIPEECQALARLAICEPPSCSNGLQTMTRRPAVYGVKSLCASDCSIDLIDRDKRVLLRVNQNLNNVLYVAINGDDATAERGNLHCVYRTIEGAEAEALPGDLVYVHAGEYYPSSGLGTNGVSVYCQPGVIVNTPGNNEDLITDVGKGSIIYNWSGHATIICPPDAGRILFVTENGSEVNMEVDMVEDNSNNQNNGFVPGAQAVILNFGSSQNTTDPSINPRNKVIFRFKDWVATDNSGLIFRIPFSVNGQGELYVHGETIQSFSRIITVEDRGVGHFHVDRVDVNSIDPNDSTFVARDVGRLYVKTDIVRADNTASNSPVIDLGRNDLIGLAFMDFQGIIVVVCGSLTGALRNFSPIEMGGGTLIFKGHIDFTITPGTGDGSAGAPIIRVRNSTITNVTNIDLSGSFCHNGGGLWATTTMRGILSSGNPAGPVNVILRDTNWRLPDPANTALFGNTLPAGMTIYPLQDVFTNSNAPYLVGGPLPVIASDTNGPTPMAAIRTVPTLPCFINTLNN